MSTNKRKKPTKAELKSKKQNLTSIGTVASSTAIFKKCVEKAAGKKIVLHIGCSTYNPMKLHQSFRNDNWYEIRLDIDPSCKPDIVSDMTSMPMIPDNSVDAIWSSHNVEHLYPHIVPTALQEFYRIIKPEGHFLVTLPDLETVCNYVARGLLEDPIYESPAGPICAIDILYGFRRSMARGNLYMAHKTGFTAKTLGLHLQAAGFSNTTVTRLGYDLWAQAYKLPAEHPNRVDKIAIKNMNQGKDAKLPEALPLTRTRHPGYINERALTDEINIAPKLPVPALHLKNKASA